MAIENNYEEWLEIRSRVDSIATAVFLLAGGALSLSINIMLGNKNKLNISATVIEETTLAWYGLLFSIMCFLLVKVHLIAMSMVRQFKPGFVDRHIVTLNLISWVLGLLGFISFLFGMLKMVQAAVATIGG
tara:strand:+ start:218 stop:610 length:393 start_codon:yes stop_codon:yes gene_type:complete